MKTFSKLILLSLAFMLTNCANEITRPENEECDCYYLTESDDSFVFGKYFGFCMGEQCTNLYKIQDNQVFADNMERLMHPDDLVFKSEPLSNEKYQVAKAVLDAFPEGLLAETAETIGCPDCADQGGYFIELKTNGETRRWYLDNFKDKLPAYLKTYTAQIDEALAQLQ